MFPSPSPAPAPRALRRARARPRARPPLRPLALAGSGRPPPCLARRRRVLVVGSGGREHALAWRLSSSPGLTELHAAPGNPGIARLATCHPVAADDAEGLLGLARFLGVDLVVVGPEAPLVAGVADLPRHARARVSGA